MSEIVSNLPPFEGADVAESRSPPRAENGGAVRLPARAGLTCHGGNDLSHNCSTTTPFRHGALVPPAVTTPNQHISIYMSKARPRTHSQDQMHTKSHEEAHTTASPAHTQCWVKPTREPFENIAAGYKPCWGRPWITLGQIVFEWQLRGRNRPINLIAVWTKFRRNILTCTHVGVAESAGKLLESWQINI